MNNSKDNLEDFFHQSFKDEESVNQAGDWNLPSDAVWEGIQEGMTEERKLSFIFLKWPWSAIAASYLLIMGGYQFFEKYIEQQELSSTNLTEELLVDVKSTTEVPSIEEFSPLEKEIPIKSIAAKLPINRSSFKATEKIENQSFNLIESIDNQLVISKKKKLKLEEKWLFGKIDFLNQKNVSNLEFSEQTININPVTPALKKPSKMYVAANYSAISGDSKVFIASDENNELMAKEKNTQGSSFGVNVGWSNKKGWAIETGIHYTQLANEAVVTQTIPGQVLAANSNSSGISEIDMTMNNAYGSSEIGLRLINKGGNTSETGMALSIQLAQTTQSRFVEIPLLVRKNWNIGKLNVSVKTGLLNRFNVSNEFETPSITVEDNQFEVLANDFRRNTRIEQNKYTPQLIAGIGLEYYIQPNLSVYIEPTYSRSLRPVIDFGFANIHTQNKALTMGMRYHL